MQGLINRALKDFVKHRFGWLVHTHTTSVTGAGFILSCMSFVIDCPSGTYFYALILWCFFRKKNSTSGGHVSFYCSVYCSTHRCCLQYVGGGACATLLVVVPAVIYLQLDKAKPKQYIQVVLGGLRHDVHRGLEHMRHVLVAGCEVFHHPRPVLVVVVQMLVTQPLLEHARVPTQLDRLALV